MEVKKGFDRLEWRKSILNPEACSTIRSNYLRKIDQLRKQKKNALAKRQVAWYLETFRALVFGRFSPYREADNWEDYLQQNEEELYRMEADRGYAMVYHPEIARTVKVLAGPKSHHREHVGDGLFRTIRVVTRRTSEVSI